MLHREGSGFVEEVGEGVTGFKKGDRVAYMTAHTYAEYVSVTAAEAVQLPDELSLEQGAAMMIQGSTALTLVRGAYEVKPGDFVLVHAAAGGTGRLLVQLCKHFGAFVIGTTSSAEKAAVAKAAGADEVVIYTEKDIVEEVKRITGGKGVHAVFDGVGRSTFDASLACLRRLGTLASFGNASGKVADVDIMKLVPRAVKLMRPSLFEFLKSREDFETFVYPVVDLVKKKVLKIEIFKVYDLKDAATAQTDLQ
ncbi:hypothetical protein HK405_014558, partial [Cladochytrium tenue]